jgi:hypothetical protein
MNNLWSKETTHVVEIQIGDILFKLHSNTPVASFSWINNIPKDKHTVQNISIWYDETIPTKCQENINTAFALGHDYFPAAINDAYKYLGLNEEQKSKHITQYKLYNSCVYVHFKFPSEDFYLIYDLNSSEIYLNGNVVNLERILLDFICMTSECLLLHAACVSINGSSIIILGDSNSGKTSIALSLIKRGASYIGDDIIYVTAYGEVIRCCDFFSMRQKYVPHELLARSIFYKADKLFFNINDVCDNLNYTLLNSGKTVGFVLLFPLTTEKLSATKLFCAFRRDSMWSLDFIGTRYKTIENMIIHSTEMCIDMIKNSTTISYNINFTDFEASVDGLYQSITNHRKDFLTSSQNF